nr:MAG TPA: hypothetical protein [Bacteriophage sp.]
MLFPIRLSVFANHTKFLIVYSIPKNIAVKDTDNKRKSS